MKVFDQARKSYGTDEDIVFVYTDAARDADGGADVLPGANS